MQEPLKNFLLVFGGSGLLAGCFKWGLMWARPQKDSCARPKRTLRYADRSATSRSRCDSRSLNVGDKATSLEPDVRVRSVTPKRKLTSVGSRNSDLILSGNSDHLGGPAEAPGRTPAAKRRGGGKDDRHAQATRDPGAAPGQAHAARRWPSSPASRKAASSASRLSRR